MMQTMGTPVKTPLVFNRCLWHVPLFCPTCDCNFSPLQSNATQPNDVPGTAAEGEGAETAETSTNKQSETSLSPSRRKS